MNFRTLIAASVLALGCSSESAEFSREKRVLSSLEQRVAAMDEHTPEKEICDIAYAFQGVTAEVFFDHDWILGGANNHPLYDPGDSGDEVSAVYIPGKGFENIQGMQCNRNLEAFYYSCSLGDLRTGKTPSVSFHVNVRQGIFPPRSTTGDTPPDISSNSIGVELAYPFDHERNMYTNILSATIQELGDMLPPYKASCPDIDIPEFTQRVYTLAAFAESLIPEQ